MSNKNGSKKRCNNCNTLLIKATVIKGIAELQCDVCGHSTIIKKIDNLKEKKYMGNFRPLAFG